MEQKFPAASIGWKAVGSRIGILHADYAISVASARTGHQSPGADFAEVSIV